MTTTHAPAPASDGDSPPTAAAGRRLRLAVWLATVASWVSRHVLRRGGNVIGGQVLLRVAPESPRQLAQGRQLVMVSGTNGKSTTTALLAAALRTQGPVVHNADGANTHTGLVTALAGDDSRVGALEVDEGWLPWAVDQLSPYAAVLLNLTRDQLHRNPEVRLLASKWREPLRNVELVVANCDDPAIVWAAGLAPRVVWVAGGRPWREDSIVCPACGDLLAWEGERWSCACGLSRPQPVAPPDLGSIRVPGEANRRNADLALVAATAMGAPPDLAAQAVSHVADASGRYAEVDVSGRQVRLLLAKNPASWQETMRLVGNDDRPVVLAFNADGVDGLDPSWLYDVDFTPLRGRQLTVTGKRATDLSVRLRIDEVVPIGQFDDLRGAIRRLPEGPVDLVATYSAFNEARRMLT